jgi:DNA polymerase III delta prime subunit
MGPFKVVHLEEFDYLSQNAQGMLRVVLEENSGTCRFITTCNYENKIILPIRSRFQQFRFKAPTEDDVVVRMIEILEAEGVSFDDETLVLFIKQAYPDLRKIINNMQENSIDGKLLSPKQTAIGADYKFKLIDLLQDADIRGIRKLVSEQVPQEELEEVYRFLWQNLGLVKTFKADSKLYDKAILVLDKALETSGVSALPHLTFEAACIRLMMVLAGG